MTSEASHGTAAKGPPVIYGYVEQIMRVAIPEVHNDTDWVCLQKLGTMQVGPWTYGLDNRPAGFSSAVILDNTLATALQKRTPTLKHLVTTELQLNFLRNLPVDGSELTAWARAVNSSPEQCCASGTLADASGNSLVEATAWYRPVMSSPAASSDEYRENAGLLVDGETAQPLENILQAEYPECVERHVNALDVRRGFTFLKDSRLANALGYVHGGALAMMVGLTAQLATRHRVELLMQSLRVFYIRPGQGVLHSRFQVRHSGNSFSIVDIELLNAEGKIVALAQASFSAAVNET